MSIENENGNFAKPMLAVVFCYQVNYMNKDIHEYILIEWTDECIKFKWKNKEGKWRKGSCKFYAHDIDEKWFKTKEEATDFVSNSYDKHFLHPRQNDC